jgi:hypothetical protein
MPHPRRLPTPKIPRFSSIVKDVPVITSPHPHENVSLGAPPRQFNPRVAAYMMAFIGVLIGGVVVGAKYKDFTDTQEVFPCID